MNEKDQDEDKLNCFYRGDRMDNGTCKCYDGFSEPDCRMIDCGDDDDERPYHPFGEELPQMCKCPDHLTGNFCEAHDPVYVLNVITLILVCMFIIAMIVRCILVTEEYLHERSSEHELERLDFPPAELEVIPVVPNLDDLPDYDLAADSPAPLLASPTLPG